jgi:hypothetical protein
MVTPCMQTTYIPVASAMSSHVTQPNIHATGSAQTRAMARQ